MNEKVSFEGIGAVCATYYAADGVKAGMVVKLADDSKVDVCGAGDRFFGVAVSDSDGGCVAVQMDGVAMLRYSGDGVAAGWIKLAPDTTGGVKKDDANGHEYLVLSVDAAAKIAAVRL